MTPEDRAQLVADIATAIQSVPVPQAQLSDEELAWVRLAIQKEAQSIALRRAIIEKSLGSLVWGGVVAVGYVFLDFFKNHGMR